jgi:hypothetical protein
MGKRTWTIISAAAMAATVLAGPQAKLADTAALTWKGNIHSQDSLGLALQAAATHYETGRDTGHATVFALLGNAFAMQICPDEPCTAWWHVGAGRTQGIHRAACELGLQVRKLPDDPAKWQGDEQRVAVLTRRAGLIAAEMAAGRLVLVEGGWDPRQAHGFVPWGAAGVITEIREDGTILGATLNGRSDNIWKWPYPAWVVTEADTPPADPSARDRALLENAVARVRNSRAPDQAADNRFLGGLAGMDLWIEKMKQVPFCPECGRDDPNRSWSCASDTARTMLAGSRAAAQYLRACRERFPEEAREHLDDARAHYRTIAELLTPAVRDKGEMNYRAFIGDVKKQAAHAEVLAEARAELAKAADALAAALEASQTNAEGGAATDETAEGT